MRTTLIALALAATFTSAASAQSGMAYGPELEGFDYPFRVERFTFPSQRQHVSMTFMDIAPDQPDGRTVVLLHGKNFCAATWEATIRRLLLAGYRVIAPDQVGFCKSTKPAAYQYSFEQLAANTHALLNARGIQKATVIGHSMGGMLAARYALMFPDQVEQLVLVNPLGLEDWRLKGVPPAGIEAAYQDELETSFDSIKAYQMKFYYNGKWKPEYDRWVAMLAGMNAGSGKQIVAWSQALTSDMVYTQPVIQEFSRIKPPTLLLIGGLDRTAPGADRAPDEVAADLGNYAELGRKAARSIPNAKLIEFPDLGHSPQVESPDRFHDTLIEGLKMD